MHQFRLGPPGALRCLPSPSLGDGPEATAARLGGVHRSLGGRVTVDRVAVKRTWRLTWPYLDPDTAGWLDTLHTGVVPGPLWLVDPQRRNRLSARVAATGSAQRSPAGITPSGGAIVWSTAVPATPAALAGGLLWAVPAVGGQLVADRVPVAPGESGCGSLWALSTSVPVMPGLVFHDQAGEVVGQIDGPPAPLSPDGQRLVVAFTAPEGAVTAHLALGAGAGGGDVATTAWQLETDTAAPTAWAPGGGAAEVVIDSLTTAYPVPGSWATVLTLLEV